MTTIVCALAAITGVSLLFSGTRKIGILCIAVLAVRYPIPVAIAVSVGIFVSLKWG